LVESGEAEEETREGREGESGATSASPRWQLLSLWGKKREGILTGDQEIVSETEPSGDTLARELRREGGRCS